MRIRYQVPLQEASVAKQNNFLKLYIASVLRALSKSECPQVKAICLTIFFESYNLVSKSTRQGGHGELRIFSQPDIDFSAKSLTKKSQDFGSLLGSPAARRKLAPP